MSIMETSTSKIYEDVPIPPPSNQVHELLSLLNKPKNSLKSPAQLFYEQALNLVDYEDDYPQVKDFFKLSPTYESLNLDQLRGYFTWRANLRKNKLENAPLPYALIYSFELLNLIGVNSEEEAFRTLKAFYTKFSELNALVKPFLSLWLKDFLLFYDLDPILLKEVLPAKSPHSQGNLSPTKLLGQRSSQNQEEIFDLICQMTSYKLTESTFFKEEPQAVKTLVCQIFTRLWQDHQAKNDGTALFGQYFYNPYMPFKGAIFYERVKPQLGIRVLTNGDTYEYRPDGWKIIKWYPIKTDKRLDVLLKVCESRLRKAFKFKRSLKEPEIEEDLSKVVNEELAKFLAEKRQLKVQPIEIDRSKLKGIREEALDTQQKLIVEEEVEEAPKICKIAEEPRLKNEACEKEDQDTPILLAKELAFLKLTLQAPQKAGFAEELLADAINEKLFPYFEDTVLILEDEHFILISDYTSKLKELLAL